MKVLATACSFYAAFETIFHRYLPVRSFFLTRDRAVSYPRSSMALAPFIAVAGRTTSRYQELSLRDKENATSNSGFLNHWIVNATSSR